MSGAEPKKEEEEEDEVLTFTACYTASQTFEVPKSVFLLDEDDDKNDGETPGSWWIKWGTFFYIDKERNVHAIEGSEIETNSKRPDVVTKDE